MSEVCTPASRAIVKFLLTSIAIAFFSSSAKASVNQNSGQFVQLAWNPVFGKNIVGYNLYFGGQSGSYTNRLLLGNVPTAFFNGAPGTTYFFSVKARDTAGGESGPSNEITYTFPSLSVASVHLNLNLGAQPAPTLVVGMSNGITITSSDVVGSQWVLEASEDLRNWRTVAAGSNSTVNTTVVSNGAPALFFRLKGP